ncbi:BZ3500_MvSof-1268-A1-R1_Chr12-2g03703 [Microbotryum saponariae]|uniref:BZ3500_MvSof-1268-A1-R1_Chr12-2g03703 protein n=1 Tax=Microbotryum saponariae TaxID=289078 RepID=A0A2X0LEJ1_9BASI|nr:BZ3500_MvSof-1268-A1-R1_Chr12-2g03703 [Microbotryum saponariae]SDA05291.1 BZ3501_MvSof-1269-A2-R1_Chr12-1g03275 [Microbotryum saponariae]
MHYLSAALGSPFDTVAAATAICSDRLVFEDEAASSCSSSSSSSSASSSSAGSPASSMSPTFSHTSCRAQGAYDDEPMISPAAAALRVSHLPYQRPRRESPKKAQPRTAASAHASATGRRASTAAIDVDVDSNDEDDDFFGTTNQPPVASTSTGPSPSSSSSSPTSSSFNTGRSSSPASRPSSSSPSVHEPILHPEQLLQPLTPPPNSFASAQAAMAAQNSSHSQNLIGHMIDNSSKGYPSQLEFISILGLGAYGVVYLARDVLAQPSTFPSSRAHPGLGNQPLYAVKCLNKLGLDERQLKFQRREILLHSLASPHGNVVTLHNYIVEENCIYVVLQFCEEGDLFGMITERQRYLGDDELIRSVFLQIVDAVEFCHQNSIYHRDLKPENILCLDDGKKVVLADFGLATHEKTSGDFGCGSTFYMSPECQGGLFQRLTSYSTPHNDIWSLGVILVNLTCGRNPWKQACPSDETFCAYLGNPDFLRSILPISEHTNRILKRIFALNPKARINLRDLRREILSVKTFVMTDEELRHATKATKEAARAFAQGILDEVLEEEAVEAEYCDDLMSQDQSMEEAVNQGEDLLLEQSAMGECNGDRGDIESEGALLISLFPCPKDVLPATPTQPFRAAPLITPPATPRRGHRPADITPVSHQDALRASYSRGSSGSEESSDSPNSDEEATPHVRRRRRDIFLTPPSHSRSVFESVGPSLNDPRPPSPVTPTTHRRTRGSRNASPRSAAARLAKVTGSGQRRQRKTSFDSSSSSSGASASQPPTPTGPPVYSQAQHYGRDGQYSSFEGTYVHPAGVDAAKQHRELPPDVLTAYYPVFSADWHEAATEQASHYTVTLPPPVLLPSCTENADGTPFEFPLPPTGHYHRAPARAGEIPRVEIFETSY